MSASRRCPGCRRSFQPTPADPWRPFCSERCRLLDLGAWLTERHAIPGETAVIDGDTTAAAEHPDETP